MINFKDVVPQSDNSRVVVIPFAADVTKSKVPYLYIQTLIDYEQ